MTISEVVMPQMGADMKEGTVVRWLKSEGQPVNRGEPIAEIETDKANVEIEAFGAGVFRKVLSREGDVVPVGTVIAVIAAAEDDISSYEPGSAAPAPATEAPAAPAAPAAPSPSAAAAQAPASNQPVTPGTPENPQPAQTQAPAALATPEAPPTPAPAAPRPAAAASAAGERLRVSPVARRRAEELGIDVSTLTGSGPDGRILLHDVESARAAAPSAPAPASAPASAVAPRPAAPPMRMATPSGQDIVEDVPLTRIRQTIARRMQQSKQEAPHYYLQVDVDMTETQAFRVQANAVIGDGARITVNDLIVMATTRALMQHPSFNAWWVEDHLQTHSQVNIGIAVPLDDGLVVPCLLDCAAKGLSQLAYEARDLADRARSNHLRPEEYGSPTFSVSNLGAPQFGIDVLTAIINPPQVGVLGVGAVVDKPVVRNGEIVIRSIMSVVLAADHRASDGADGARFLQTIKRALETPALMLL